MPKLPGVNHLRAVRGLEKAGFTIATQGKHVVMTDGTRIITVPRNNPVNEYTMRLALPGGEQKTIALEDIVVDVRGAPARVGILDNVRLVLSLLPT